METLIGLSGVIDCPTTQGIVIKSIQVDVSDPATTDVVTTLSGSLGTEYTFNAISPVVQDLKFKYEETVDMTSSGTSIVTVIVNYIIRGDQQPYMTMSPSRRYKRTPGKWNVS